MLELSGILKYRRLPHSLTWSLVLAAKKFSYDITETNFEGKSCIDLLGMGLAVKAREPRAQKQYGLDP